MPRLSGSARQAQILETAVRHFAQHGFNGARTRAIARECGITEPLLFHHFPGKKALYRDILDSRLGQSEREIFPPLSRFRGDDRAFLCFLASRLLARMESEPLFTRLLLYSALEEHRIARDFVRRRVRKTIAYLARFLARRSREGAFRRMDPVVGARAFLGMVVYHSLLTHLFGHPLPRRVPREALVGAWVDLFLDGARRRP